MAAPGGQVRAPAEGPDGDTGLGDPAAGGVAAGTTRDSGADATGEAAAAGTGAAVRTPEAPEPPEPPGPPEPPSPPDSRNPPPSGPRNSPTSHPRKPRCPGHPTRLGGGDHGRPARVGVADVGRAAGRDPGHRANAGELPVGPGRPPGRPGRPGCPVARHPQRVGAERGAVAGAGAPPGRAGVDDRGLATDPLGLPDEGADPGHQPGRGEPVALVGVVGRGVRVVLDVQFQRPGPPIGRLPPAAWPR